jgi:hypothetical protein
VQTRVLGLVDVVGKGLWEDAVLDVNGLEKEDGGGAKTKSMRKRGNMAKL